MYASSFFVAFAAVFGLSTANPQIPSMMREFDDAELVVAPNLRFDGDKSALKVAKIGEKLQLRCEAFGQPAPVVYWTRNGEPLAASAAPHANWLEKLLNMGIHTYQIGNTVALHRIPCVTAGDRGVYTCVADNGHQKLQRDVELIVGGGGKISLSDMAYHCFTQKL